MHSSKADGTGAGGIPTLELLSALGFGPGSGLLRDPKIFVDGPFLAALQVELDQELGVDEARAALLQIGMIHGLRDALRLTRDGPKGATPGTPVIPIRLGTPRHDDAGALVVQGTWPEGQEAQARLSRLGATIEPACALSAGYTSGWLSGTFDRDLLAVEDSCAASGDEVCHFVAREVDGWRLEGVGTPPLLDAICFDALRALAEAELADGDRQARPSSIPPVDPGDPAVHVWGPVLVLPYTNMDDALQAAGLLGSDPTTRGVRVVVFDLRGAILDEGLDAADLEQVAAIVEAWGAELILTGVSSLTESVVATLEPPPLLRKDLSDAIAYGFQIAEAQRYLV